MSDLLDALKAHVVTRPLDLSELGYDGAVLNVRVNWTRGQKRRRWQLANRLGTLQAEIKEGAENGNFQERAQANAQGWRDFWADILVDCDDAGEVQELQEALPDPHWQWISRRITKMVVDYEEAETKKAVGSLSPTGEVQAPNSPKSTDKPPSPDT